MKKSIIGLALVLIVVTSSAFAGNTDNVNEKIINAFNKEFVQASDIQWTKLNGYYKATFRLNDHVMYALYLENGTMASAYRSLVSNELPIYLQSQLRNQFTNYWISDLHEYASKNGSGYSITIENADQVITLKSMEGLDWQVMSKVKK